MPAIATATTFTTVTIDTSNLSYRTPNQLQELAMDLADAIRQMSPLHHLWWRYTRALDAITVLMKR